MSGDSSFRVAQGIMRSVLECHPDVTKSDALADALRSVRERGLDITTAELAMALKRLVKRNIATKRVVRTAKGPRALYSVSTEVSA
jgi:DNA-binding HxlR family transcriptional regulator